MIITKIVRQKKRKDRVSIFVDDRYAFSVSESTLADLNLKKGQEVDESYIANAAKAEENKKAVDSSWRLLGVRSRSEKELVEKLRSKKLGQSSIDNAINRVKELGYINDEKFAQDRIRQLRFKGKGPALIKMELRKAGVENETITELMSDKDFTREQEVEQIKTIVISKLKRIKDADPKVVSNKIIGFLARRGFDLDSIRDGIKAAKEEIDEDQD